MPKVVVSEKALREMVREALDSTGWSGESDGPAVNINPVTDPSCSVTDPVNPNFTPQNKTEFGVAMQQMVKNLPDTDLPGVFTAVKKALDTRSEKDELDAATQQAMVAGSQQAIDAAGERGKDKEKHEGKMPTMSKVEEQLRARIRKAVLEAHGLTEADLPPVKKIPMGVHGGEYMRRHQKTVGDLQKNLGKSVERYENDPLPPEEEEPVLPDDSEEGGEAPEAVHVPKHAHQGIGAQGEVGAASFEDIAKEMDMSVSGAKQLVDKALLRFTFLMKLDPKVRLDLIADAFVDYVDMLEKTGELTPADVQLLDTHKTMVMELDGFREYLHNVVRREMKKGEPKKSAEEVSAEDQQTSQGVDLGEDDEHNEFRMSSVAKDPAKKEKEVDTKPGKVQKVKSGFYGRDVDIDWGGFDEGKQAKSPLLSEAVTLVMSDKKGPYVIADGVEARPTNPNHTQYKAGTRVNVHRRGQKGVFIVEMPNGEKWSNKLVEAKKSKTCEECGAKGLPSNAKKCEECGAKLES